MTANLTAIILTCNEELNVPHAIKSVSGWAKDVFVLDSGSTDETVKQSEELGAKVFYNKFENYSKQRNYALTQLPVTTEWILFLDADEYLMEELKEEIAIEIEKKNAKDAYQIKYRLIWMEKWIKRGYYPTYLLRLVKRSKTICEERAVNEHLIVDGEIGYLENDIIHEDRKGIISWSSKHLKYIQMEADELCKDFDEDEYVNISFWGNQAERRRWLRYRVWGRMPRFVRPFLYFIYRYFINRGFLDGKEAFIFHFLHGCWFPFMIDCVDLEKEQRKK
ncbi:MAG: glycosyltransferase family 2 protein [Nitrospinae bacterium]|nr:glycosyltransferase family 2 protein [Nitrospinota bacterium]